MTEKAKEARREYRREWNRRNPEKQKEYQRRHWEKVAAMREAQAQPEQEEREGNG